MLNGLLRGDLRDALLEITPAELLSPDGVLVGAKKNGKLPEHVREIVGRGTW